MASRSERRAALAAVPTSPTVAEHELRDEPAEASMKIQFQSVLFEMTIPRLTAQKGLATQDTSFFDVERTGTTIELDTASSLVRLSKDDVVIYVPRERVIRFGDVV